MTRALPPPLAVLFERHRPVGPREIYAAWRDRATELGLHPGEILDVNAAAFQAGVPRPDGPFRRADVGPIFDALEGTARSRRPRWRLEQLADGTPLLRHDPEGAADNLAAILGELRPLAALHHRRVVLAAVAVALAGPEPPSLAALAIRWSISGRTLRMWRAEGGKRALPIAAERSETGHTLGRDRRTVISPESRVRATQAPARPVRLTTKRSKGEAA